MNNIDKGLVKMYMRGWNDSAEDNPRFDHFTGKEHDAYQLGWYDFVIGDDVPSSDLQTEEEILKKLKA